MANIQQRVGRVDIRVGGNTQETATLVPNTSDGRILEKDKAGATNPVRYVFLFCRCTPSCFLITLSEDANSASYIYTRPNTNDARYFWICQRTLVSWRAF